MKIHSTILFIALVTTEIIVAQQHKFSIETDFSGGAAFYRFTKDSLVAPRRRAHMAFGSDLVANAYFLFSLKNPALKIRTGIGYAERDVVMNQSNWGDFIVALYSFNTPPKANSFSINQLDLRNHYINIPLGLSYDVTQKTQRVHFCFGIQLNAGFLVSTNAKIQYAGTSPMPTPDQQSVIEKRYEETSSSFVLGIQPRIEMRIRLFKQFGIQCNLAPMAYYANSWNKRLVSSSAVLGGGFGIQYNFN